MNITQRRAVIAIFVLQTIATFMGVLYLQFLGNDPTAKLALLAAFPIWISLLVGYLRGWDAARYVSLVLTGMLVAGPMLSSPATYPSFSPLVFIPPILALVLADPIWIVGLALGVIGTLMVRSGWQGQFAKLDNLIVYALGVSCLIVARRIADGSRRIAEIHAREAESARAEAERQAQALAAQAGALAEQNAQQQQLIELVAMLETPAVTLADGVLLVPLLGALDQRRLLALTTRLLHDVESQRARMVVLDLSGIASLDVAAASGMLKLLQSIRLLGAAVMVSGIASAVAQTLVAQGIMLDEVVTVRSPQEALERFVQEVQPAALA